VAAVNFESLTALIVLYGTRIVGALAVAVIGWWVAGLVERATLRGFARTPQLDPMVAGFVASIARYAVLVVIGLIIIQLIGIQATSLVAVLGAASLAVGLALQGTLSNLAAGVMLLIFRPFKIGDDIEVEGKRGRVKALNLFITELAGADNTQILMPNGKVWGAPLTNFSTYAQPPAV
jgi:small conductance mechanosensitive channel